MSVQPPFPCVAEPMQADAQPPWQVLLGMAVQEGVHALLDCGALLADVSTRCMGAAGGGHMYRRIWGLGATWPLLTANMGRSSTMCQFLHIQFTAHSAACRTSHGSGLLQATPKHRFSGRRA